MRATLPTTSVTGTGDTSATGSSSDTGGEPGFCGDDPPKGFVGPFDAACKTEPKIGTFTPVLEWNKQVWVDAPAYNQVMMTPIVAIAACCPCSEGTAVVRYVAAEDMDTATVST